MALIVFLLFICFCLSLDNMAWMLRIIVGYAYSYTVSNTDAITSFSHHKIIEAFNLSISYLKILHVPTVNDLFFRAFNIMQIIVVNEIFLNIMLFPFFIGFIRKTVISELFIVAFCLFSTAACTTEEIIVVIPARKFPVMTVGTRILRLCRLCRCLSRSRRCLGRFRC